MARRRASSSKPGWRPTLEGEWPTLGHLVAEWIEAWCVIPDGPDAGKPFRLTGEQYRFLLWFYRLKPTAEYDRFRPSAPFEFMHAELVRPQKWGKGPFSAAIVLAEALGPVRFGSWDEDGQPIGIPVPTPWIQVAAASEGQTDNIWRALLPMIHLGPLSEVLDDVGLSRINLHNGGFIEPVTSSALSRLGQRLTFCIRDETHSWFEHNNGWFLADTLRRNLAGMGGRSVGTSNAPDRSERSDLQRTIDAKPTDVYIDYPPTIDGSLANKKERRKVLLSAYGDSAKPKHPDDPGGWIDIDRIESEVVALIAKGELAQAERFFANRQSQAASAYFNVDVWIKLAQPGIVVPRRARVTLGFDGSKSDDWTAIRGRWVRANGTMHAFQPRFPDGTPMWWNPHTLPEKEVPVSEVLAAFEHLFAYYRVLRLYADPPHWQTEIDELAVLHPETFRWDTYRRKETSRALERLRTDMATAATVLSAKTPGIPRLTQDGDPMALAHLQHARALRRPGGTTIAKASDDQKIDITMADLLAHEAGADAITAGEHKPKPKQKTRIRGYR